jgi:hypothetical protein
MGKIKTLYHVTHADNLASILEKGGIDPKFSKGKLRRAYYVEKAYVEWAMSHTCVKHHWAIENLVILRIKARAPDFSRMNWPGLLFTQIIYRPYAVDSAVAWLKQSERVAMLESIVETGEFWSNGNEK